jgi:RimJ/RimL family protein N-acetyltransferase
MSTFDPKTSHRVETPRLIIRLHQLSDAKALVDLWSNPINVLYEPEHDAPSDITVPIYEERIKTWMANAAAGTQALWVVALRSDDGSEGEVKGCGGYPWLANDPQGRVGNTGIVIDEKFAKRGLGSEGIIATLDYGFDVLGFNEIEQETHEINEPYRALMRSVGLEPFGERKEPMKEGGPVWWKYSVTRDQWKEMRAKKASTWLEPK